MKEIFIQLGLPLYISTTVLITLGLYIEELFGEMVYFIVSILASLVILYQCIIIAKSGRVGSVVFAIMTAYLLHLLTSILINRVEKDPLIFVLIEETWWYILVAGVVFGAMLIIKIANILRRI